MKQLLAAFAILTTLTAPTLAQSSMAGTVRNMASDMTAVTGRPIAILTRSDNDPAEFWYKAALALCDATGDNWCDDDTQFITDTTNQLGWARVLTYTNDKGETKQVCALLPPRPGIHAGYAATAVSGGTVYTIRELPENTIMETWIYLMHLASCQNDTGSEAENKRAANFATMALTLIQGDTQFVGGYDVTPSRLINKMKHETSTRWSTNVGERLLLEYWKGQVTSELNRRGCNVTTVTSTNLNTDYIQRDSQFDSNSNCYNEDNIGYQGGQVTDENLWLWTQQGNSYGLTIPVGTHVPFAMFSSQKDAIQYMWTTASSL